MSGRKNMFLILGFVMSLSLLVSSLLVVLISNYYSQRQFELLNSVCDTILEQEPEVQKSVSIALKSYIRERGNGMEDTEFLEALGYHKADFMHPSFERSFLFAVIGCLSAFLLFSFIFFYRNQQEALRVKALTRYLEQANMGKAEILGVTGEDAFSKLEDEIYKTVTFLYQTKDAAIQTKNHYAENLSNIAHQIKTPITAISLSVQTMRREADKKQLEQIQKQLLRLTHLEEALLVLSRLDAGVLEFQREHVDVFTLLVLAADTLQELWVQYDVSIDIPELEEIGIHADLNWTMEAVMNLMKNCMEHNQGGTVHCDYKQNPLYTEIFIWDEGNGFYKEDIPHLFERFYRGQNAGEGGIGIGLALSKEIIERQNGTIRAKNIPDSGACFEIRFYSH